MGTGFSYYPKYYSMLKQGERAVYELAQLADKELFGEISQGLRTVVGNALNLWRTSKVLFRHDRRQGCEILRLFAEEEASKFFILIDVVRCPRQERYLLKQQLNYFYDHLAKGIYTQHYESVPADFREVKGYVENFRQAHFLDGPEGFEYIYKNTILDRREELLYTNYVRSDNGCYWVNPRRTLIVPSWETEPEILRTARLMCRMGFANPNSLEQIAIQWRKFPLNDTTHWGEIRNQNYETIKTLQELGLIRETNTADVEIVLDRWNFPLYPLNLRQLPEENLVEVRKDMQASWERGVYGVPEEY